MHVRRQHRIVEGLREHGRREERDRSQRLPARIDEIMPHRRWQDENASRPNLMVASVFQTQLSRAGDNILGLLGRVRVPAKTMAGLNS